MSPLRLEMLASQLDRHPKYSTPNHSCDKTEIYTCMYYRKEAREALRAEILPCGARLARPYTRDLELYLKMLTTLAREIFLATFCRRPAGAWGWAATSSIVPRGPQNLSLLDHHGIRDTLQRQAPAERLRARYGGPRRMRARG